MRTRCTTFAFAVLLALAPALAGADVAPGDVITAANKEKLRGLIPEALTVVIFRTAP